MDAIRAWIENGAQNAENFFIDDDREYPSVDGTATICVGGIFVFYLSLSAPHTITMRGKTSSPSLRKFLNLVAGEFDSPGRALSKATESYLQIADALDEENADDEDYTQEDTAEDVMDIAAREAATSAEAERRRKQMEMDAEFERVRTQYDVTSLPKPAVERILADYNQVRKREHKSGWTAEPNGRDLSLWNIELCDFEKGSQLEKDMAKVKARTGKAAIQMTMKFPKEYPFKPPFIRVVRPRFVFHTGRVTVGGSICTQLLTDDGWKPIYDIESVMETVRQQITDPESKAAIDHSNTSDYTEAEALEAFRRVAEHHKRVGW